LCEGLTRFMERYLALFSRKEQHQVAMVIVQGCLSNLELKTSKSVAYLAWRERKLVLNFVRHRALNDEAVMR
jgi:hypothetical protein